MKTHKTWTKDRGSFTYEFLDGRKIRLSPGEDGVTEAEIAMLHRMDDREVENNNKHIKPPLQNWQKDYVEDWVSHHPGEEVPERVNASLDAITDPDVTDTARKNDPVLSLCSMAVQAQEEASKETQAVRDFVEEFLTDEQKKVYQRVLIDGERVVTVAEELGVSFQSVSKMSIRIKKKFRENFKNFFERG